MMQNETPTPGTEAPESFMTPLYEDIYNEAQAVGISIAELCRVCEIARMTLDHWKRKEPLTIQNYRKIWEVLDRMKKEKEADNE